MVGWEVIAIICAVAGLYGIRVSAGIIEHEYRIACKIRKSQNRARAQNMVRSTYTRRLTELDEKAELEQSQPTE